MILHSVPVVVLASISALVGLFFLSIYLRYPKDQIGGSFALVCFAIVLYDIGCIGLYNSTSFSTSAEWQRFQFMAIALLTIALSFFYHKLTGKLSVKTLILIGSINIGFILIGYTIKNHLTLSPEHTAEKLIVLGGLLNIHYMEARPGIIYNLQVIAALVVYTICLFGLINFQQRSGQKKTAVVVAIIIFYFAAVNDALVGMGLILFPYLFEYAFSALIVSMAVLLVNDFLNLHDQVEKMNLALEATVREQSQDLKVLSGLLPICASCKKIRDDKGYWNQIESYIHEHSDAEFSHSICPECAQKLYSDLDLKKAAFPEKKGEKE
jgi:hypothetical protein